jgi:two-component system CheB/CheR fusion protein
MVTILMIAIAVLNRHNTLLLHENARLVDEAHKVIDLTNGVLLGLVDTETGERGFLLTGNEAFLKPYTIALPKITARMDELEAMTAGNAKQQTQIHKLLQLTTERLALLKERIDLRRKRVRDEEALAAALQGKDQMDAIRSLIAEMELDERELLNERHLQSTRAYHIATTTGLVAALAGLVFLGAFVSLLNRNLLARQEALTRIGEQRELFRTTLASIGDAVITTDQEARVTFLNSIAEQMTGWQNSEAQGLPLETVFRIVREDSRKPVENPATRALRDGKIVGLANHTVLIARDGSERSIDDSAAPIRNEKGAVAGVVLVFRDISGRLRSDKALREADRLKDEYLAMLAHELRNPLAPIRNSLQIMKQPGAGSDMLARAREIADRQVQHMARLLEDLLDVSRISRGRIELRSQVVDVVALVKATADAVRPLIEERGHDLMVSVPGESLRIHGDPTRLEQVLTNLLNNAAKYTKPRGKIWLTAESEDSEVLLRVRDDGLGISSEMLPRIFDLFVQAQRREDRTQGGIGIGLTLVRRLVELHKGTVEAFSSGLGMGSEFVVHLPALKLDPQTEFRLPAVNAAASTPKLCRRILVVDDNIDAAESLACLLRLDGHDVQIAFEGHAAIAKAKEFQPEFAFLDIGMPAMDGYAVAARLREEKGAGNIFLVALTGWGQESDRRRSQEAGFDLHLVKPVDPDALRKILAR